MELVRLTPKPEYLDELVVEIVPGHIWEPPTLEQITEHGLSKDGESDPDGWKLSEITFFLRAFDGDDQRVFSDKMLVGDKKGRQRMNAGDVAREKILRGVVRIEGLANERGEPISRMTPVLFKNFPAWILNKVQTKINERLLEEEDDEDF